MNFNFSGMPFRTDVPPPAPLISREDAVFVQALAAAVTDVIEKRGHAQDEENKKKFDETMSELKKARKAFAKATPADSEDSESTVKESLPKKFKDMAENMRKNVIEGVEEQLKKQSNEYQASVADNFKASEANMATLRQNISNDFQDVAGKMRKNVIEGVEEQLKKQRNDFQSSVADIFKASEATMATLRQNISNDFQDVAGKMRKNVIEGVEEQLKKQRNDFQASASENFKASEATIATLRQNISNELDDVAEKVHKRIMVDVEALGRNLLAKVEVVGKKIEDEIMAKLIEKLAEQRGECDRDSATSYDLDNGDLLDNDDIIEAKEGPKDLAQLENEIDKCFGKTITLKPNAGTSSRKPLSLPKTSKSPKPSIKRPRRKVGGSDDDERSKPSKTKKS